MAENVFTFFVNKDRSAEIIQEIHDLLVDWDNGDATLKEIIDSILAVEDESDRNAYLFTLGFFFGYADAMETIINAAKVIENGFED